MNEKYRLKERERRKEAEVEERMESKETEQRNKEQKEKTEEKRNQKTKRREEREKGQSPRRVTQIINEIREFQGQHEPPHTGTHSYRITRSLDSIANI